MTFKILVILVAKGNKGRGRKRYFVGDLGLNEKTS